MNIKGIITAAGLSSRMGAFKPLLELNGFTMIEMAVNSLRNGGVSDICIVTGRNAEEVESAVSHLGVSTVRNENFATTDMLTSVKLGLECVKDADAVFLLPCDIPLVSPKTLEIMRNTAEKSDASVLYTRFNGKKGHPPLIKRDCFDAILEFSGENGLKGALQPFACEYIETDDECTVLDADYENEFQRLKTEAEKRKGVSRSMCEQFYEEAELLPHIRAHCRAVGELAEHMARELTKRGICLDAELSYCGGALHDIRRLEKRHNMVGSDFLKEKGYLAAADMVYNHNFIVRGENGIKFTEAGLVCLADKLVRETERVQVIERYRKALEKFPPETELGTQIMHSIEDCNTLADMYFEITGEKLQ